MIATATTNATRYLWVRIGEGGNWQRFDDLQLVVEYLNLHCIGKVDAWVSKGLHTPNYWGLDYVILYWGDEDARLVSLISADDRAVIEDGLEENFI